MGCLNLQNNIINFYEFFNNKETNKAKKVFEIMLLPLIAIVLYFFIKIIFLEKFITDTDFLSKISKAILICSFIVIICLYIVYNRTLKGVFIYSDYIQIVYAITKRNLLNIKPKIKYTSIKRCEKIVNNTNNKIKYNIAINYIAGNNNEYVMLETVDNKLFFFCVENQDAFIEDVVKRMKS